MEFSLPDKGPRGVTDVESLQELVVELLNVLADTRDQLAHCQQELQEAKDEINRLKREKGQPKFRELKAK